MTLLGLVLVNAAWLHYLWLIPREEVPERPLAHNGMMVLGSVLALAGMHSIFTGTLAVVAVAAAVFFGWLGTQAPQPDGALGVSVGDVLPDFEARDHEGALRSIREWRGQPMLLKFYRGFW